MSTLFRKFAVVGLFSILCLTAKTEAQIVGNQNIKVIDFKKCVEQSKQGKLEQANFESLKKQMETVLAEDEKKLNEMGSKFKDTDFLDSLSPEAESKMKMEYGERAQEISQKQQEYLQTLQRTNMEVIQNLREEATKAAEKIAKSEKIGVIIDAELCLYIDPAFDVTKQAIALLDQEFEKSAKTPTAPQSGN